MACACVQSALYAIAHPSVTRVDRSKTVEVRIVQFLQYLILQSLWDKFHPEILIGSSERGRQTRVRYEKLLCANISKTGGYEIRPKLAYY